MAGLFDSENGGMSGMFGDKLTTGKNRSGNEFFNGPAVVSQSSPTKNHRQSQQLFNVQMNLPEFKDIMKALGLKSVGRYKSDPIEIVIYNDAKREPTPGEASRGIGDTYFAKFIEWGFTKMNGEWYPGLRLFSQVKKRVKRALIRNYKQMAHRGRAGFFSHETVVQALEQTAQETVEMLAEKTPLDAGRGLPWFTKVPLGTMRDSWGWFRNK